MRLLGNRVLLERVMPVLMSPGGVHYSDQHIDDRLQYYVLAIGPGKRLKDGTTLVPDIRPGDKCLCNSGHGVLHTFEDGRIIVDVDNIQMVWR